MQKLKNNFPKVCIYWYDAHDALDTGWHEFDEIEKKSRLAECVSIGWLFREDEKKYVLIADITEGEEGGRVTVIPKGWIKKIISDDSFRVEALKGVDSVRVKAAFTIWGSSNEAIPI